MSCLSNGKHNLARVDISIEEGMTELSNFRCKGAIKIGNSGSLSPTIRQGENDSGEFLSPIENSLENLSLEIVLLARGRSSIGCRWKHFA